MAIHRTILAAVIAVVTLAVTTAASYAAPAQATANVNVRSGPGTNFRVIDTLIRGERVDIQYCRGSWCFVEKRGPNGWVSANYLSRGGWQPPPQRPPVVQPPPRPQPPGWHNPGPRPPGWHNPRPPHGGWQRPPNRPPGWNNPRPPQRPGASFCYNGPSGYVCFGT